MSLMRWPLLCLAAIIVALAAAAQTNPPVAVAAPVPASFSVTTNTGSAPATRQSPVAFFRKLLQAGPAERNKLLATRPGAAGARILVKLREYEAMPPEERELKLQATELRYYLLPLMKTARADRTEQLAKVPPELLPLVKSRLLQWDILPPPLQAEFLAHDDTAHYFAQTPRPSATNAQAALMAEEFKAFFEIKAQEKQRVLSALSAPEREQMEKTLKTFEGLPEQQRLLCVRNYAKFAGMSETERAEFLKNAESWSQMSPEERQAWRDLVAEVPIWPPMPPPPLPPLPPGLTFDAAKGKVVTN